MNAFQIVARFRELGEFTQRSFAEEAKLTQGAVSRMFKQAEDAGIIRKTSFKVGSAGKRAIVYTYVERF